MGCTKIQADKIIEDLYSTDTVMSVLKKNNVDTKSFYKMLETVPSLTESYIRAQSIRADMFAELVVEESRRGGDANHNRNRMNALIWAASKMKPDKYGDRVDINLNQTLDIRGALDEARNRIRDIIITPKLITNDKQTDLVDTTTGSQPVSDAADVKTELDKLLE